ncbi:MAG: MBL fold metallo-hydrolase [Balneolales bacterium]
MDKIEITPEKLQTLLYENKPVFILDIRPQKEREDWFIPGSTHHDIYQALKEGDDSVLDAVEIPNDKPVVTVCAGGRTSLIAAEMLQKKGIQALSLAGGMKTWNYAWNTAETELLDSDARIIQVRRTAKGCLSYIIGSGKEALVVDAALEPEVYLEIAKENNWQITYVMDTHIHADYISRTRELAEKTNAEHIFIENAETEYPFTPIKDRQVLTFGSSKVTILHTPGHTKESTSYLINEKALLTGDTLFTDGVGRPDLKADKNEAIRKAGQLYKSLQKILTLPVDTIILPAHLSRPVPFDGKMVQATISSLKSNLELLQLSEPKFIDETIQRIPEPPENYLLIAGLNKKGSHDSYTPADLEAGGNRCAVA